MEKLNLLVSKYKAVFYVLTVLCLMVVIAKTYVDIQVVKAKGGVEVVKELPIKLKEKLDGAECKTTQGQVITINAPTIQDLLADGQIIIDLNTFKTMKDKVVNGKKYVYYARYGAIDEWYTVATPIKREFIKVDSNITK